MSKQGRIRFSIPKRIKKNVPFRIKSIIRHPMELPEHNKDGTPIVKKYNTIHTMKAFINNKEIMSIEFSSAVSSNPYIQFKAIISESSELNLLYLDQLNNQYEKTRQLKVIN